LQMQRVIACCWYAAINGMGEPHGDHWGVELRCESAE